MELRLYICNLSCWMYRLRSKFDNHAVENCEHRRRRQFRLYVISGYSDDQLVKAAV